MNNKYNISSINDINKRYINFSNYNKKFNELLNVLENQLCLFFNEIKVIKYKLETTNDVKKTLVLLNLLQMNFLNIIKLHFENLKLEDNYYICKFLITENKLDNFSNVSQYYNFSSTKKYNNDIFETIYFRLNHINNYKLKVPIFTFNIDQDNYCLSFRMLKYNEEDFYYTITPYYIYSKMKSNDDVEELCYLKEYLNNILSNDISKFTDIIKLLKDELLMVENIVNIIKS